jgi:formyl-CoA transferase
MLQVSGYGDNTTARDRPGFGKVGEAMSGVVTITGFPDGPPVHTGFSHADAATALMGAFAITAALTRRQDKEFRGERIDLALYETLYRLIEWQVIVFDQLGAVPVRAGNKLFVSPGAVVNTYRSRDGAWITVTSATPRSVQNVARLLGFEVTSFQTVADQATRAGDLDRELRGWIASRDADDALNAMIEAEVVASRVFDMSDIAANQTYRERESITDIDDDDLGPIRMQNVVPKLENYPGRVWRSGPSLGADNTLVYREYLGMSDAEVEQLRREGVI